MAKRNQSLKKQLQDPYVMSIVTMWVAAALWWALFYLVQGSSARKDYLETEKLLQYDLIELILGVIVAHGIFAVGLKGLLTAVSAKKRDTFVLASSLLTLVLCGSIVYALTYVAAEIVTLK